MKILNKKTALLSCAVLFLSAGLASTGFAAEKTFTFTITGSPGSVKLKVMPRPDGNLMLTSSSNSVAAQTGGLKDFKVSILKCIMSSVNFNPQNFADLKMNLTCEATTLMDPKGKKGKVISQGKVVQGVIIGENIGVGKYKGYKATTKSRCLTLPPNLGMSLCKGSGVIHSMPDQ